MISPRGGHEIVLLNRNQYQEKLNNNNNCEDSSGYVKTIQSPNGS